VLFLDEKELTLKQVPYHQGVYVDSDASLRDVRDMFLETGQLESDQLLFRFLDPNSHNRLYSIEEEEVITLDSMELSTGKLSRTLFIKSVVDSSKTIKASWFFKMLWTIFWDQAISTINLRGLICIKSSVKIYGAYIGGSWV